MRSMDIPISFPPIPLQPQFHSIVNSIPSNQGLQLKSSMQCRCRCLSLHDWMHVHLIYHFEKLRVSIWMRSIYWYELLQFRFQMEAVCACVLIFLLRLIWFRVIKKIKYERVTKNSIPKCSPYKYNRR